MTPTSITAGSSYTSLAIGPGTPSISGFSPHSDPRGSKIKISGTSLEGATKVTIGEVVATIKSDTATKIVIKIPATASSGEITVKTTGGKVKTATAFTVT